MRGWRQSHREFAARHKRALVLEWGYFDRVNDPRDRKVGHWQLSPDRLNNLPHGDFPPDRFEATGIELKDRLHKSDGYVLICAQVPEDAAVIDVDYPAWLLEKIEHYQSRGETVFYRPHPRSSTQAIEVDPAMLLRGDLAQALDGAKFVVCYNSNTGHDALLSGVPVVCDAAAPYYELSGEVCPSKADRLRYFSRAAYGQWRHCEIRHGLDVTLERMGYGNRI